MPKRSGWIRISCSRAFAVERFLYRLSCSRHAERLVLKGALLMLVWLGETIRPARDADLLGLWRSIGAIARANLHGCVQHRCRGGWASILAVVDSRRTDPAGGSLRRDPSGAIGQARLRVQVDVGIGDAVTPEPEWLEYPGLLDLPRPRLRAYRGDCHRGETARDGWCSGMQRQA